ncbi:MAG: sulfatase [Planctomycetota bacterium]|jgi:N-sulfoglucosamine sulfohydrolase|nr:sulfatase [Planctomycetota bacterium]
MAAQPNILTIVWHDTGRWFGCYGNESVHTPHADGIATEGVRFGNCLAASALCSPSRAALFTGRLCQHSGVMYLTNEARDNRIGPDSTHLARHLKQQGYHTARFGTLHEAAHEHVPIICDFDSMHACDPWPQAPVVAEAFEQWVSTRDSQAPFYAQVGLFEAHTPWDFQGIAGDDDKGIHLPPYLADTERNRVCLRDQQGALRVGDAAIGRILAALDKLGIGDNTIVCMQVDHGIDVPRAKTTCYDPGLEVAWLLRWRAGQLPAGHVVDSLCTHIDVLPTLCELAQLPCPSNCDGLSFANQARGTDTSSPRTTVFSHFVDKHRSVRTATRKLIRNFTCQPNPLGKQTLDLNADVPMQAPGHLELYDLEADPNEFHDLSANPAYAKDLAALDAQLWDFLLNTQDFIVHMPVRTPWQLATRRDLEAHCTSHGRTAPIGVGPLLEPHAASYDPALGSTKRYFDDLPGRLTQAPTVS